MTDQESERIKAIGGTDVGVPGEADEPIRRAFERAAEPGGNYVVVTLRPRSGKTTAVLQGLERWLNRTGDTCGYYTYSENQADSQVRKLRDSRGLRGIVLAGTVGNPHRGPARITGMAVLDDPLKSMAEARNPIWVRNAWDWVWSSLLQRLQPRASLIIVQTVGMEVVPTVDRAPATEPWVRL